MRRHFDHVDLRVRNLDEARPLYEGLLPALGFTRDVKSEGWLQYEAAGTDVVTEFVRGYGVASARGERVSYRVLR